MAGTNAGLIFFQDTKPEFVSPLLYRAYRLATDDALVEMAQYLQDNSPRGISPASESLKGSWDIIPTQKLRGAMTFRGAIVNYSDRAANRLEGRGPGKFPPFSKGTPLARWAKSKGIPPFLVARKIAREGTERWKDGMKMGRMVIDPSSEIGMKSQVIFYQAFEKSLAARI